jgi:sec-independent protein translocase protein TatC
MADTQETILDSGLFHFLAREFSELRRRLLWCVACVLLVSGALVGLPRWEHSWVMQIASWAQQGILPEGVKLVFLDPLEAMLVMFKISMVLAVAACIPILAYHFVAFTLPALDQGYRRYYVGFVAAAVGLFALGAFLTSAFFLPLTVKMLVHYGLAAGGLPQITFDKFYSFVFLFLLVFSLPFETPLVMGFLHHFNLVPVATFKAIRLKTYGVLLIVSQFVTPDPLITPTIFTVMSILLYEAGILLCYWL